MSDASAAIIWKWGTVADVAEHQDGTVEILDWRGADPEPDAAAIAQAQSEYDAYLADVAYVPDRAAAYRTAIAHLKGVDGATQIEVLGFVVDAMAAQVEAMRVELGAAATAEWTALVAKIAEVKAAIPKPQ